MPVPIRAILFDLDGVIRHFDRDREAALEARHRLPPGALRAALFEPIRLRRAVTGLTSDELWRAEAAAALAQAFGHQAAGAIEEWGSDRGRVDPLALSLVQRLRASRAVGLLTNATSRLPADLRTLGLADAFDVVVNSCEAGCCKPDPQAYELAASRLRHPPSHVLFVDDTPSHVEAARSLGMAAIRFTSVQQLELELASAGIG
jgi:putative hydrolase of the HAD superfamily